MKEEIDIDKIFIRATDKEGKWGSFSLKELWDMDEKEQIINWMVEELGTVLTDSISTENTLDAAIELMEAFGVTIFRIKDGGK